MAVKFKKHLIDPGDYEACSVFDVNNDGQLDIVCGAYWYEGPNFTTKHQIQDIARAGEYWDDFSDFPMDVNGDGYMDIVSGSWFGPTLRWLENPGPAGGLWKVHHIDPTSNIETIRYYDIDGCGTPEVFPNTPGAAQCFYKLVKDENGKGLGHFRKVCILNSVSGHGMGFADVNSDGRMDVILTEGWLECPADPVNDPWVFHREFNLNLGGMMNVPTLGFDVNGDGLTDLIVGQGHGYGLYWFEQHIEPSGRRVWIPHEIEGTQSQYHDQCLVDIDNDGQLELVTGSRYKAHNGNDPGEHNPIHTSYFKIDQKTGTFTRFIIDEGVAAEPGTPDSASGVGIYMWIADLKGSGRLDIVAPGKEGLYVFENVGE